jgi:hypothetical protein
VFFVGQGIVDILEALAGDLPAAREALAARSRAVTAERAKLLAELSNLEKSAELKAPRFAAAVDQTTSEVKGAEVALLAAQTKLAAARAAKHTFHVEYDRSHAALWAQLKATASPLIAKFVAEMDQEWVKTRRAPMVEETSTMSERNPRTGRFEQVIRTNAAAVGARLRAILGVIAKAWDLAITEADQSGANIGPLLGALGASLPAIA